MAKPGPITYACGHTTQGSPDWQLTHTQAAAWLSKRLCPACVKKIA